MSAIRMCSALWLATISAVGGLALGCRDAPPDRGDGDGDAIQEDALAVEDPPVSDHAPDPPARDPLPEELVELDLETFPPWGCDPTLGDSVPALSFLRRWCIPPGESLPECGELVRGDLWCELAEPVSWIPSLFPAEAATEAWRASWNSPALEGEVPPTDQPRLECHLAHGCPELIRSRQFGMLRHELPKLNTAVLTGSGAIVWALDDILRSISPEGELLWEMVLRYVVHDHLMGLRGTDDVLVAWHPGWFCGEGGAQTRIGPDGNAVWTRTLPTRWWPSTDHNSGLIVDVGFVSEAGPYVSWLWCGVAVSRASDGQTELCGRGGNPLFCQPPPEGAGPAVFSSDHYGRGVARGWRYSLRSEDAFGGFELETGRGWARESPVLENEEELDEPSTAFGPVEPFFWYDGSLIYTDFSKYYRVNAETGQEYDSWDIRAEIDPSLRYLPLNGGSVVSHSGWIFHGYDFRGEILIDNLFRPGGAQVYDAQLPGLGFWNPSITRDGTLIYSTIDEGIVGYTLRLGEVLWRIHPDPHVTPIGGRTVRHMLLDDGTLVLFSDSGVVTWWRTVHGGLADTPVPTPAYDNYRSRMIPLPPFATEPELEPQWKIIL